jgi:thiamine biosynthesis lipoprotein
VFYSDFSYFSTLLYTFLQSAVLDTYQEAGIYNPMKKYTKLCIFITSFTLFILLFSGCTATSKEPITKSAFMLNTVIQITLYDNDNEELIDRAFNLCEQYEQELSKTIDSSEISKMNHRTKEETTFPLTEHVEELLLKAQHYSEISNGGFDVTIGAVSDLWNFTSDTFVLPSPEDVASALPSVGYHNIQIKDHEITFLNPDTKLDLGAIAKGYIADQLKQFLVDEGVTSGIINLGGNVLCIGERPDGTPFKIGLQKPFKDRNETVASMDIVDMTVVSSGVYERNHFVDDVNYHHLLDSKTGYPLNNGLISVTIITSKSVDGDGLSTTCFSLGMEDGMELINSLNDTYAVFITSDGVLHYSDGAKEFITQN